MPPPKRDERDIGEVNRKKHDNCSEERLFKYKVFLKKTTSMIERKSCGYEAFSFGRRLPDGEKSSETYVESEALRLIL